MTEQEAVEFAVASAEEAVDQQGEYSSLQHSVDSYRDNVRDTLNDAHAEAFEVAAWEAFDARIISLTSN